MRACADLSRACKAANATCCRWWAWATRPMGIIRPNRARQASAGSCSGAS